MDINQVITGELGVKRWQVDAAVKLIDEGNTIPFIARYRKEVTGTLDDAQLRTLHERLMYLRNLEEKKEQVLASIEEQGKLTEELKKQILAAETMVVVEDLYRPYRPKRRTRAMIAKEKGLEPLAALITLQKAEKPIEVYAEEYVNSEKEVKAKIPEKLYQQFEKNTDKSYKVNIDYSKEDWDNNISEETKEILMNYLNRNDRDINKLYRYAEQLKCIDILRTYLEVLT